MLYALAGAIILFACILVIYGVFYLSVIGKIQRMASCVIGMTKKQMKSLVSKRQKTGYVCFAYRALGGRRCRVFDHPIRI
ncbi:MAG: hypothetical protein ACLVJO_03520 [[Clostridium] scindens]